MKGIIFFCLILCFSTSLIAQNDGIWTKTINHEMQSGDDKGFAITRDDSDNIYIVGTSMDDYYFLMKLNSSGVTMWSQVISQVIAQHTDSDPKNWDITLDSSENIYISGRVGRRGRNTYLTKFDSSGTQLWETNYRYSTNGRTGCNAIDVDSSYIYLTGVYSENDNRTNSILFVKLNQDGVLEEDDLLWTGAPSNTNKKAKNDGGYDIIVNNSKIFITGIFTNYFLLAELDTSGEVQWDFNYGLRKIYGYGMDIQNNIYISGYDGVDQKRNLFIAKISDSGSLIRMTSIGSMEINDYGFGIHLDTNQNPIVVGALNDDYGKDPNIVLPSRMFTGKFSDIDGSLLWAQTNDYQVDKDEFAYDVINDSQDNIYIIGFVMDADSDKKAVVIKYTSDGTELWSKEINIEMPSRDKASDVAVDPSGNIYVYGSVNDQDTGYDLWIAKYNRSGTELWSKSIDSGAGREDAWLWFGDVVYDQQGNLYVTTTIVTNTNQNERDRKILIGKYDYSTGAEVWSKVIGTTNSCRAGGMAIDNSGHLYVTGRLEVEVDNFDIWIAKYNDNGVMQWSVTNTSTFAIATNSVDSGNAICADTNGNVYVVGYISVENEGENIWVQKVQASDGAAKWTKTYNNPDISGDDSAVAVTIDIYGNIIVGGRTEVTDYAAAWLASFKTNGTTNWIRVIEGQYNTYINDVVVDTNGVIIAIGITNYNDDLDTGSIWISMYNPRGEKISNYIYNNPVGINIGYGVAITPENDIIAVGRDAINNGDIWIRKYNHVNYEKTNEVKINLPDKAGVYPNYADISKDEPIRIVIAEADEVEIKIFNLRGVLVQSYERQPYPAAGIAQEWNGTIEGSGKKVGAGIYLVYINGDKIGKHILKLIIKK